MNSVTYEDKIKNALNTIRMTLNSSVNHTPFIAFSGGKDSLAVAALVYEALAPKKIPCIYVHHDMEFPDQIDYIKDMRNQGFDIEIVTPFLNYFELIDRGIGFLTRQGAWCVPVLVGTGLLKWLKNKGARTPREGLMFRGISGSEYSHKFHQKIEIYDRLELPCVNPVIEFTREEILTLIHSRYTLPINPIYKYMDRTYCICCYTTTDKKTRSYSEKRFPEICNRYYREIEKLLFESRLIERCGITGDYAKREEKIERHGFIHWRRSKLQETPGAVKYHINNEIIAYKIRHSKWISLKHLEPVKGNWVRKGNEIRFFDLPEKTCDILIKRMINCLDCGFCMIQCFSHRKYNDETKKLEIEGCCQCGECISLKYCIGWKHRFWRRVIVNEVPNAKSC